MAQTVNCDALDPSLLVEEEMVHGYKAERSYPVRIGDPFHNRYKVIGKLGYGSASTVWLCHDRKRSNEYVHSASTTVSKDADSLTVSL